MKMAEMTNSEDRLRSEAEHYDRYFSGVEIPGKLLCVGDSWLSASHEYHGFGLKLLGDVKGLRVLVAGCGGLGGGGNSVWLAKQGAIVTGVDITAAGLALTEKIALLNGVKIELRHESAESTGFDDECFDRVLSYGVYHHLERIKGAREFHRVLKKEGELVIIEPWNGNPLLRFARDRLWYPGKNRTEYERALDAADIECLSSLFKTKELHFHELFSSLTRVFNHIPITRLRHALIKSARGIDRVILAKAPGTNRYCRVISARFTK